MPGLSGHKVIVVQALCHIFKRDEGRPPNPQTPHSRFGAGPVSSVSNRAFVSVEVTLHQVADQREIDWWVTIGTLCRAGGIWCCSRQRPAQCHSDAALFLSAA